MNMFNFFSWRHWLGLAVAVTAMTTAACTQPKATSTPAQSPPLTSATLNWIGNSSYYVADKKGLFAENGLVTKEMFFPSSSEIFVSFMTRDADIAWVTSGDAVQMIERDPSVRIIYTADYSNGADGIIGRNIKLPRDIKGKTIARENILYAKVFLRAYLQKAGLTEKDVTIRDMPIDKAATAFANKQIDAAVSGEPFMGKAMKAGGGSMVFSSKDSNLIADVIVVRQDLLQTRKPELQAYLKAVDKAVKLLKAEDPEALKITATKMGISVDEVKSQIKGVKIFDLLENKTIAFNKSNPSSIFGNLALTTKGAADFKATVKPINPNSLYDTSLIE